MSKSSHVILFKDINSVSVGTARLKECGPDEILCQTLYSMISPGTELRMLAGHYGTAGKFPFVPGYSSIDRVIGVGSNVKGWRVNDLVNSRNALPFADVNTLYGAHASLKILPAQGTDRPVALPLNCNPRDFVLTDIAAISLRGVEAAAPKAGETSVVIGQGLIGSLSAQWLAIHGCRVIAVDPEESRLQRALRNGAAFAVSPREENVVERIQALCNGGADIVVEASGTSAGVGLAWSLLRKKPQNYAKEFTVEPIRFYGEDWPKLVFQANYLEQLLWKPDGCLPGEGAIIIAPRDRGVEERQRVVEHIRTGRLVPENFIEEIFPWRDAPLAYDKLRNREILSAVIDWTEGQ